MIQFISGAIMAACFICCMFFFRGWRQTGDRLLLMFGIAFALLTVERVALASMLAYDEAHPEVYLLRMFAFVIISVAIVHKNMETGK